MEKESNDSPGQSGLSSLLKGLAIGAGIGVTIGSAILGYMVNFKIEQEFIS